MEIRADFENRKVVHSESLQWVKSPMPGVDRRPLDRVGDEVARATSIVRYAPNSHFSSHVHTGGEEFLVLSGVFQDEHGDYPTGSYIRNPPQSSHTPGSQQGCVIFVKLWQFQPQDRKSITHTPDSLEFTVVRSNSKNNPLVSEALLYEDNLESVKIIKLAPNISLQTGSLKGVEILVLDGSLIEGEDTLVKNSWLRLPVGSSANVCSGNQGTMFWIKTGNLDDVQAQIERLTNASVD